MKVKVCALQEFLAVNLHGTVNLAQAAAKAGVKRFVFVSSVKVNGEFTENQPFSENDIPQLQDAYAISKWEAEIALRKIENHRAGFSPGFPSPGIGLCPGIGDPGCDSAELA